VIGGGDALHVLRDVGDGEALRLDVLVEVDHHMHHGLAVELRRAAEVAQDDVRPLRSAPGGSKVRSGRL
jgi:hypothetical protein